MKKCNIFLVYSVYMVYISNMKHKETIKITRIHKGRYKIETEKTTIMLLDLNNSINCDSPFKAWEGFTVNKKEDGTMETETEWRDNEWAAGFGSKRYALECIKRDIKNGHIA